MRQLQSNNDILTFIVYDADQNILLTKTTGTGIDQTDDGTYVITIPSAEINSQTFPGQHFRYYVRIQEGDTGERYLLQRGPLTLETIP